MKKKSILPVLCLYVAILSFLFSCERRINQSNLGLKMNYPLVNYAGIGWLDESKLAAFVSDENVGVSGYYLENDDHFYSLHLPPFVAELDCNGVEDINYSHPSLLPDGRLGLINSCISRGDPPGQKRQYMVAYNFQTKATNLLVKEPLPNYLSNGFTWNPDMTQGLQQIYGGLNGTIYWMSSEKIMPVDFAISDGKRSFLPAKDFPQFSDSSEQGIVFSPVWSPNGRTIAFFVTLDAIGRNGFIRSDGEYKIFFMDPIEQKPVPVADKIYHPSKLIWSPDSTWLAFVGEYGASKMHGLWLYSTNLRKVYFIASGIFENIAWSPDGNRIAATKCESNHPNQICERYEIWEYNLTSFPQK